MIALAIAAIFILGVLVAVAENRKWRELETRMDDALGDRQGHDEPPYGGPRLNP